jgi:hypothetical protein
MIGDVKRYVIHDCKLELIKYIKVIEGLFITRVSYDFYILYILYKVIEGLFITFIY